MAECQDICDDMSDCVGFDFNTDNNRCWIHDDADNFESNTNTNAGPVTQYAKVPCEEGSATSSVGTGDQIGNTYQPCSRY